MAYFPFLFVIKFGYLDLYKVGLKVHYESKPNYFYFYFLAKMLV
jgi:hypothetical protein